MHRSAFLLFYVSLALVLPTAAEAQSAAGSNEFAFAASFDDLLGDEEEGFLVLEMHYGRFLSDAFEILGGIAIGGTLDELDEVVQGYVFGQYHFTPEKTTTWYAKGGYIAFAEELDDGFVGAGLGLKVYLRANVAFFWEAGYGVSIRDRGDGVLALAGLSYFF